MAHFFVYTKASCPFCQKAKALLTEHGHPYTEVDVSDDPELRAKISAENNDWSTVPMIFEEGADKSQKFIGGYSELATYLQAPATKVECEGGSCKLC